MEFQFQAAGGGVIRPAMNWRLLIVAALGIALAAYLIFYVGASSVMSAAVAIGWGGFAALIAMGLGLFLILGAAWHVLAQGLTPAWFATFLWGRMVRDSAAEVLPFSAVGGFVIGARAVILRGISPPVAFGSTIVDVTTEMMAQIAYVMLGIVLLTMRAPVVSAPLTGALVTGLVGAAIAGGLFVVVQRKGLKITEKLAANWLPEKLAHATAVAAAVDSIYREPARIGLSFVIHLLGWIASAVLTWVTFRMMGAHIDLAAVIAIDSLVYAARSATFVVPNALGVQEAAFAVLASMFGVGPELGLAVSLLKRARDVAIGAPVLLAWQAMEGSRALAGASADGNLLKPE
jgi:putative membrane protein